MSASNRRPILLATVVQHPTKMPLARNKTRKRSCGSLRYRWQRDPDPRPLRSGARASPSPRNADKPHYREPKVPLSTNAGVLQTRHRRNHSTITEDVINRARRSPSKQALSLCSAESVSGPPAAQVHARPRTPPRRASHRGRSSRRPAGFIHSHQETPYPGPKGTART